MGEGSANLTSSAADVILWIWIAYVLGICLLAFLFAAVDPAAPMLSAGEQRTPDEEEDEEFIALPTWWW